MIDPRNCQACGIVILKPHPMQKYCPECSETKDLERKKLWARSNPPKNAREKRTQQTMLEKERGIENARSTDSIANVGNTTDKIDLNRIVRVSVPFSYGYSKNAIYSMTGRGHVYLRQQTRDLRNELTDKIVEAMGEDRFFVAKIYLDIFVEKPDHKGDAVNVIDTVCDAVKDAIGIDDRWFSIRNLDWSIVKRGGRLFVGVGQEATEDERFCHRCGRNFPLSTFLKASGGSGRVCKECRTKNRGETGVTVYVEPQS